MTKVDKHVNDEVSAEKMHDLTVKAYQQGAEFVNPSEGAFAGKATFVHVGVEQALSPAFGLLTGAGIFDDVGDEIVVEAGPARRFGVERGIGVEVAASEGNAVPFHKFESGTRVVFEFKGVVMMACDNPGGC